LHGVCKVPPHMLMAYQQTIRELLPWSYSQNSWMQTNNSTAAFHKPALLVMLAMLLLRGGDHPQRETTVSSSLLNKPGRLLGPAGWPSGRCPEWLAADGTSSDTKARWSSAASERPQHRTSWLLGFCWSGCYANAPCTALLRKARRSELASTASLPVSCFLHP
jgi:hypothetical protein